MIIVQDPADFYRAKETQHQHRKNQHELDARDAFPISEKAQGHINESCIPHVFHLISWMTFLSIVVNSPNSEKPVISP
jgi:hypothetical protein